MKIRGIVKSVTNSETGEEKVTYIIGDTEDARNLAPVTVIYDQTGATKITRELLESLMGLEEGATNEGTN